MTVCDSEFDTDDVELVEEEVPVELVVAVLVSEDPAELFPANVVEVSTVELTFVCVEL